MRWDDRSTKYYKQIQTINIRLSNEFGRRLMAIDSSQMLSNDRFVKVFKGLHISVDDQNSGKSSLIKISPSLSTTNSSSVTTTESFMITLYKKFKNQKRTDTIFHYYVGQLSASANHFSHDYSKTRFANKLNNDTEVDSFIYVQPMAGLRSRIHIPSLKNWKDSSNIIINKAKVTFYVDSTKNSIPDLINSVSGSKFNGIANFNTPDSLQLLPLDKNGDPYYPRDYVPSASYYSTNLLVYGGHYNNTAGERSYSFGITKHLQDIIDGKVEDYGFVLVVPYAAVEDKRVVLEGPKNNRGIRLDIVYTKYKSKPSISSE